MNVSTPRTVWGILDHFVIELGKGDVCKEKPSLTSPLYQKLVDLVCRGDTKVLDEIGIVKPFYPFILIAYHLQFQRQDTKAARAVFERLRKAFEEHPDSFDSVERCMHRVLENAFENKDVENISGSEPCEAFKHLVLYHKTKNPEHIEKAIAITEQIEKQLVEGVDEEIAEAYNIIDYSYQHPIHTFLKKSAKSLNR